MYLHIGSNKNIRICRIVGIFDLDSSSTSQITKDYLKSREKAALTEYSAEELPKTFLLTDDGMVHFSQISSGALIGRLPGRLK